MATVPIFAFSNFSMYFGPKDLDKHGKHLKQKRIQGKCKKSRYHIRSFRAMHYILYSLASANSGSAGAETPQQVDASLRLVPRL